MGHICYIVHHWYDHSNGESAKLVGIFDSLESVGKGIEILKQKPGFDRYPDSFLITQFLLDNTHWTEGYWDRSDFPKTLVNDPIEQDDKPISNSGMKEVFLLTHFYETEIEAEDEIRYIGVYSSIENANATIEALRAKPGFINFPYDFNCEKFQLNELEWAGGFSSW